MKTEIINLLQTTQALDGGNQGINARDVHRLLKVGRDYSKWIKARINQAGFIENQDFAIFCTTKWASKKKPEEDTIGLIISLPLIWQSTFA